MLINRELDFESSDEFQEIDDVQADMNAILEANPIKKERLRTIPNTNTYANSVNVYVGRPRSGKTYLALHDIISVIRNDPNVHMLVYINESGSCDDDTFDRFRQLITVPIVYVKYDECEAFIKELLQYKAIYNKIKDNEVPSDEVPKSVYDEMCQALEIKDFNREYLHTLILTEDATNAKVLKRADSYLNDLLTRCAHTQISFFIIIHYWRALTTNIKANLSTIYIFGGYSRQQLHYMLYQMNIPVSVKELMGAYSRLPPYAKLMIDCNTSEFALG